MAYTTFGCAEHGGPGGGALWATIEAPSTSIVAAPAGFPDSFAFQIDPVNGNAFTEVYGWVADAGMPANLLAIPFIYRTAADFDVAISIAELSSSGGADLHRRIMQNNGEGLQLVDADEDSIGSTANAYIVATSVYSMLWLVDIRDPSNTQDALWAYRPAVTFGPAATVAFSRTASPDTITDSGNGFKVFIAGDVISVSGTSLGVNDGDYTIVSVSADGGTITLGEDVIPVDEGAGSNITITTPARWDKAIDEANHGVIGPTGVGKGLNFGTRIGKGLPTTGGPFQVTNMLANNLNELPFEDALGSISTRYKAANAVNTTSDDDFDAGSGGNPSHTNVDDIPADENTTYDLSTDAGDKQSYSVASVTGTEDPLGIQTLLRVSRLIGDTTAKPYVYDGTANDEGIEGGVIAGSYRDLGDLYTSVNGKIITDTEDDATHVPFNSFEVGLEAIGVVVRLTQAGISYFVEGPQALPSDWPTITISIDFRQTITPGPQSVAVSPGPLIF